MHARLIPVQPHSVDVLATDRYTMIGLVDFAIREIAETGKWEDYAE
jgi:hypothetical protein